MLATNGTMVNVSDATKGNDWRGGVGEMAQVSDVGHPQYVCKGSFVEIHPACDYWMRGAKFGTVTSTPTVYTGRHFDSYVYVRLDGFKHRPVAIARSLLKPAGTNWPE